MTTKNNIKIDLIIRTAQAPINTDYNELTKQWLISNSRIFSDGVLGYQVNGSRLKIFLQSENLKNSHIRYYNLTFGLNIPENLEGREFEGIDAYDIPDYMYF